MSLHWYAYISMNTYCYVIYHISLGIVWWALSNASLIMQICPVVYEILTNKDFTVTDDLIFQLLVVAFVHPIYMQIAHIWDFPVQLSLWKFVHWLWKYKLNEVCDILLDSEVTGLVMSLEFARKWEFKLKKIERLIYVRNIDGTFNKKGLIEHIVEINIYYQKHKERTEIDVIEEQK